MFPSTSSQNAHRLGYSQSNNLLLFIHFLDPLTQAGIPFLFLFVSDHLFKSHFTPKDRHTGTCPCNGRIQKISAHKHPWTPEKWQNHCRIFTSLRFMYCDCISKFSSKTTVNVSAKVLISSMIPISPLKTPTPLSTAIPYFPRISHSSW